MSVRRREWITRKGEAREAWIVDYTANGSRHIETFERKKDADAREAQVTVDVSKGHPYRPEQEHNRRRGRQRLDRLHRGRRTRANYDSPIPGDRAAPHSAASW